MPEQKFNLGETVYLITDNASNSLPMTVTGYEEEKDLFTCEWTEGNRRKKSKTPPDALSNVVVGIVQTTITLEDTRTCTLPNCPLGKYKPAEDPSQQ